MYTVNITQQPRKKLAKIYRPEIILPACFFFKENIFLSVFAIQNSLIYPKFSNSRTEEVTLQTRKSQIVICKENLNVHFCARCTDFPGLSRSVCF